MMEGNKANLLLEHCDSVSKWVGNYDQNTPLDQLDYENIHQLIASLRKSDEQEESAKDENAGVYQKAARFVQQRYRGKNRRQNQIVPTKNRREQHKGDEVIANAICQGLSGLEMILVIPTVI